jgi:hypothetical protein
MGGSIGREGGKRGERERQDRHCAASGVACLYIIHPAPPGRLVQGTSPLQPWPQGTRHKAPGTDRTVPNRKGGRRPRRRKGSGGGWLFGTGTIS